MVKEIVFAGEPYGMNWLREDFVYGEVLCPPELEAVSESVWEGEILTTVFSIKNMTEKPFFTSLSDIGLRLPLQDKYEDSDTCVRKRCHTHIFCGRDISYVYALRMAGKPPFWVGGNGRKPWWLQCGEGYFQNEQRQRLLYSASLS